MPLCLKATISIWRFLDLFYILLQHWFETSRENLYPWIVEDCVILCNVISNREVERVGWRIFKNMLIPILTIFVVCRKIENVHKNWKPGNSFYGLCSRINSCSIWLLLIETHLDPLVILVIEVMTLFIITPLTLRGHCLKTNILLNFCNIYFLLLLSVDYFELMFISVSGSECGQVRARPPLETRICTVLLLFDSLKISSATECFWMKQVSVD